MESAASLGCMYKELFGSCCAAEGPVEALLVDALRRAEMYASEYGFALNSFRLFVFRGGLPGDVRGPGAAAVLGGLRAFFHETPAGGPVPPAAVLICAGRFFRRPVQRRWLRVPVRGHGASSAQASRTSVTVAHSVPTESWRSDRNGGAGPVRLLRKNGNGFVASHDARAAVDEPWRYNATPGNVVGHVMFWVGANFDSGPGPNLCVCLAGGV